MCKDLSVRRQLELLHVPRSSYYYQPQHSPEQQRKNQNVKDGFRQLRSFILVDEAHQFLKKDFNSLRSIISEGRGFGVGVILSTQNISDFRTASQDYTQFILSWVIHHVNSITKAEILQLYCR